MRRAGIALAVTCCLIGVAAARGRADETSSGVLYTRDVNGNLAVWELDGPGEDGHQLVPSGGSPAWSPDGSRIAFTLDRSPTGSTGSDIATSRSDGSDVQLITDDGQSGSPAWSPDGARIAFAHQAQIWLTTSGGGPATQLTHPPAGQLDLDPAWSPDGRTVAFSRRTLGFTDPDAGVWTVDVARGAETRLTPAGSDGANPAWSPDGTVIAFLSTRDHDGRSYGEDETTPNADVYVMQSDGSDPHRITQTRGPESSVAWSASGTRLIYASAPAGFSHGSDELVLSRADGGCPTPLTHGSAWHLDPSPAPTSALDSLSLQCASPGAALITRASALARQRVRGGHAPETALARALLAALGADTAIRSITISAPPAGRHAPAGSTWLHLIVTGTATRNAADAVRPTWEATLLADRYAARAAASGARPLYGLSIHYLGSGRTVSTTEAARHGFVGSEQPNDVLTAAEIEHALRATPLPAGVRLASIRFAQLEGGSAPEIVLRISAKRSTGRLVALSALLLDPLQLDQGAYLELRDRCGALIGAIGTGELGTRQRVGTARPTTC